MDVMMSVLSSVDIIESPHLPPPSPPFIKHILIVELGRRRWEVVKPNTSLSTGMCSLDCRLALVATPPPGVRGVSGVKTDVSK